MADPPYVLHKDFKITVVSNKSTHAAWLGDLKAFAAANDVYSLIFDDEVILTKPSPPSYVKAKLPTSASANVKNVVSSDASIEVPTMSKDTAVTADQFIFAASAKQVNDPQSPRRQQLLKSSRSSPKKVKPWIFATPPTTTTAAVVEENQPQSVSENSKSISLQPSRQEAAPTPDSTATAEQHSLQQALRTSKSISSQPSQQEAPLQDISNKSFDFAACFPSSNAFVSSQPGSKYIFSSDQETTEMPQQDNTASIVSSVTREKKNAAPMSFDMFRYQLGEYKEQRARIVVAKTALLCSIAPHTRDQLSDISNIKAIVAGVAMLCEKEDGEHVEKPVSTTATAVQKAQDDVVSLLIAIVIVVIVIMKLLELFIDGLAWNLSKHGHW